MSKTVGSGRTFAALVLPLWQFAEALDFLLVQIAAPRRGSFGVKNTIPKMKLQRGGLLWKSVKVRCAGCGRT